MENPVVIKPQANVVETEHGGRSHLLVAQVLKSC